MLNFSLTYFRNHKIIIIQTRIKETKLFYCIWRNQIVRSATRCSAKGCGAVRCGDRCSVAGCTVVNMFARTCVHACACVCALCVCNAHVVRSCSFACVIVRMHTIYCVLAHALSRACVHVHARTHMRLRGRYNVDACALAIGRRMCTRDCARARTRVCSTCLHTRAIDSTNSLLNVLVELNRHKVSWWNTCSNLNR